MACASSANLSSLNVPLPFTNVSSPSARFSFSTFASASSLRSRLPRNSTSRIATFGPSTMLKVTWTSFAPINRLHGRRHLGVLVALLRVELAHDAGRALERARVEERIEANDERFFFERLVDRRLVHFRQALVVDDLDALALFHVEDDDLADDAVGEAVVVRLDREIVEKVRGPQAVEVLANQLLGGRRVNAIQRSRDGSLGRSRMW